MTLPLRELYIGSGGNDGWDGLTWATRKLTLAGVKATPWIDGDSVHIGPGTYAESLTIDKQVHLIGHGLPIIQPASGNPVNMSIGSDYSVIENLHLDCSASASTNVGINGVLGVNSIKVIDCVIDGKAATMAMVAGDDNWICRRCRFTSEFNIISTTGIANNLRLEDCIGSSDCTQGTTNAIQIVQERAGMDVTVLRSEFTIARNDSTSEDTFGFTGVADLFLDTVEINVSQAGAGSGGVVGVGGTGGGNAILEKVRIITSNAGSGADTPIDATSMGLIVRNCDYVAASATAKSIGNIRMDGDNIREWYVDGTLGNDNNAGHRSDNAMATISTAITAAVAGDSINIANGTYTEQLTVDKTLFINGAGDGTIVTWAGVGNTTVSWTTSSGVLKHITLKSTGLASTTLDLNGDRNLFESCQLIAEEQTVVYLTGNNNKFVRCYSNASIVTSGLSDNITTGGTCNNNLHEHCSFDGVWDNFHINSASQSYDFENNMFVYCRAFTDGSYLPDTNTATTFPSAGLGTLWLHSYAKIRRTVSGTQGVYLVHPSGVFGSAHLRVIESVVDVQQQHADSTGEAVGLNRGILAVNSTIRVDHIGTVSGDATAWDATSTATHYEAYAVGCMLVSTSTSGTALDIKIGGSQIAAADNTFHDAAKTSGTFPFTTKTRIPDVEGTPNSTSLAADIAAVDVALVTANAAIASANASLAQTPAQIAAAVSGTGIIIHRGDDLSAALTGIGDLTGWTKLYFTAKESKDDTDANAIIQISLRATPDGDGLNILNKTTYATAAHGSLTIVGAETNGDVTIVMDNIATALLTTKRQYFYDIQMTTASGVTTMTESTLVVNPDVTLTP